ncbi:hypothetical protein OMK64_14845, partial [Cellulomonas fimi]|nr:hypothetical protein [Cellulomonas fimi]
MDASVEDWWRGVVRGVGTSGAVTAAAAVPCAGPAATTGPAAGAGSAGAGSTTDVTGAGGAGAAAEVGAVDDLRADTGWIDARWLAIPARDGTKRVLRPGEPDLVVRGPL